MFDVKENMLGDKIDNVWKYFNNKNSKLDDEIKDLEWKLANRQEMVSKMVRKLSNNVTTKYLLGNNKKKCN